MSLVLGEVSLVVIASKQYVLSAGDETFLTVDAGRLSCDPPMPDCNDPARVDMWDVEAAISHPDVQATLALATPPLFGNMAVADGPNFYFMRADGRGFNAGLNCDAPSATCKPIPPGVGALVTLLRELIRQDGCILPAAS